MHLHTADHAVDALLLNGGHVFCPTMKVSASVLAMAKVTAMALEGVETGMATRVMATALEGVDLVLVSGTGSVQGAYFCSHLFQCTW